MMSFSKPFSERKTDDQSKIVTGHRHFGSFLRHGIRLPAAFRNLPSGCAHTIKADHQGDGEFEYEAELSGQRNSIPSLAKKVIAHARSKGFHVVESEIKHDDADLKFKRGKQELDVSIEDKGQGRIEYKADLDLDKN